MADDAATVRGLIEASHLPMSAAEMERLGARYAGLRAGIDSLYRAVDGFDARPAQVFSASLWNAFQTTNLPEIVDEE